MIKPMCDFCSEELVEFGGLLFDPPKLLMVGGTKAGPVHEMMTKKRHVCVECMKLMDSLASLSMVAKGLVVALDQGLTVEPGTLAHRDLKAALE